MRMPDMLSLAIGAMLRLFADFLVEPVLHFPWPGAKPTPASPSVLAMPALARNFWMGENTAGAPRHGGILDPPLAGIWAG
jgi:hypothetical protein